MSCQQSQVKDLDRLNAEVNKQANDELLRKGEKLKELEVSSHDGFSLKISFYVTVCVYVSLVQCTHHT